MDPPLVQNNVECQKGEEILNRENDPAKTYQETIRALNKLPFLNKVKEDRERFDIEKISRMRKYIECVKMTVEDQDQLSVIHVAGTKGKGSTCSYVESILRHKGYKTGFFSSPHLKEVRERIRINGVPITKEKFVTYFWHCFNHIKAEYEDHVLSFFQLMTVISFYIFWQEKVDVCIIEVGLGGRYDCTNILRNPVACGITHLGFDHTHILGTTIESIAGHKAGIFKTGTTAVISPQGKKALEVIRQCARKVKCDLYMAPNFLEYEALKEQLEIEDYEPFQLDNISLAVQLSRIWLENHDKDPNERKWVETFSGETIPVIDPVIPDVDIFISALKSTYWAGRLQIIKKQNITYYLDGAHTVSSIKLCCDWFKKRSADEIKEFSPDTKVVKILYFNLTGDRNPHNMMIHLKECGFEFGVFSPNICYPDQIVEDHNKMEFKLDVSNKIQNKWLEFHNPDSNHSGCRDDGVCNGVSPSTVKDSSTSQTFKSVYHSLVWCNRGSNTDLHLKKELNIKDIPSGIKEADHIQVLITGSVHLVGSVLTAFRYPV